MNPSLFFDNFSLLADSPNGVQKLREMILQLAVMGKLVPQDPNDEPASVLLERRTGIKVLPQTEEDGIPYIVPCTWNWVKLVDIGQIVGGGTPKTSNPEYFCEKGVSWLTPADLYNFREKYISKGKRDITEFGLKNSSAQLMPAGTVLFSSRAPIGYVAIALNDISTNQGFKSCVPHIMEMNEYIYYFLKSAVEDIENAASGTTFKEISGKGFSQILVPLPPLEEQKRIVAKVDQLMALCDELEALHHRRNESRVHLNNAAINKLLDAGSVNEFNELWQLIYNNFDLLYDNLDNVATLRQTILQLAVMGKLVPQDPNDEPASVLLEKIRDEKERLLKEGKVKKQQPLSPVENEDIPFLLPQGWIWTHLSDATRKITDGTHHSPPNSSMGDFKYITAKNIKSKGIDLSDLTYVSAVIHNEIYSRCDPEYGDILYIKDGATTGIVTINTLKEPFSMLSSVALIKLDSHFIAEYLVYVLRSPFFYDMMRADMSGVAITRVTLKKLDNAIIPLPPLEEQKRIVAKVDQLMTLCDELGMRIRKAQEDGEKITNAVVSNLTAM